MMKVFHTTETGWQETLQKILDRMHAISEEVDTAVQEIIRSVRLDGDTALMDYTAQFDRYDPRETGIVISKEQIARAKENISIELRESLEVAAARIYAFHQHQQEHSWITTDTEGVILGQKVGPIPGVGIYIPGGKNAFPSTLLMNVIPARIAGVKKIVVVSPTPGGKVSQALLAAADIAGVESIYRIGGAQAIAALAYGTESVPKVDKVVGPGNIYVAHAKRLLQGQIGIDAFAGPSEVLIIADSGANPHMVALDLLAQAEHDSQACTILLTPHRALADEVMKQLGEELKSLERRDIITRALHDHGICLITRDLKESIDIANNIAPEHLELMVENAFEFLGMVENAGAIFLGYDSPEAIGDYIAGPNHTLPTGSTSRFYSPQGVYDFLKRSSIIAFSQNALKSLGPKAVTMARAEDLEAHARSLEYRLK
ncbi:MAG: histidinol dehydrogenase [Deltaproteobacteria bacterium]|nr:histidinol dehydrogenase [Deltaproteobacteria bacterium]